MSSNKKIVVNGNEEATKKKTKLPPTVNWQELVKTKTEEMESEDISR